MPKSASSSAVIVRRRASRTSAHEQHVRRVDVELEPVGDVLAQDRRRERPERLAVLDLEVQQLLHRRRARVAEDRAAAERARSELHPALEPADRLLVPRARRRRRRSRRRRTRRSKRAPAARSRCLDLRLRVRGPEVRAAHAVGAVVRAPRLVAEQVVGATAPRRARRRRRRPRAGSTDSSNAPSRRILPLATQLSATPPARHRLRSPVSVRDRARHPQHDLLGHRLDRRGEVHVERRRAAARARAAARRTARRTSRWSS